MKEIYRGPKVSPRCAECPCARDGAPKKPVAAIGSVGGLAIVGEGPSYEELYQLKPFVGPSGKLIDKALADGGIKRDDVWITNAILCARPSDDGALARAVECCRPRLRDELALVKPTAVVALGATAMKALALRASGVLDARGTVQDSQVVAAPVVSTIHPAAILRGGAGDLSAGGNRAGADAQAAFLAADVIKAHRISRGEIAPQWSDDIEVVTDRDAVFEVLNKIIPEAIAWGALGLDLEWIPMPDGRITWVGLGTARRAVALWWPAVGINERLMIATALADETLPKIIHNLQADKETWERETGSPIRGRIEDTMLMHHCAFPGVAHDLQQVASQYLVVPPWKTWHREQQAADTQAAKEAEKERKKAERAAAHEARNTERKVQAEARKLAKKKKHLKVVAVDAAGNETIVDAGSEAAQ